MEEINYRLDALVVGYDDIANVTTYNANVTNSLIYNFKEFYFIAAAIFFLAACAIWLDKGKLQVEISLKDLKKVLEKDTSICKEV